MMALSETQRMLGESLETLLARRYTFDQRQQFRRAAPVHTPEIWRALAELGLMALPVAEADGGLGGTLEDVAVAVERLGGALLLDPVIPTLVFGARLIGTGGDARQKARYLPAIAAGDLLVALAHDGRDVFARPIGDGFRLSGAKSISLGSDAADLLIVSAWIGEDEGTSLFLVDPAAAGVTRKGYTLFDGTGAADIIFEDVALGREALLGAQGAGPALLAQAIAEATVLDCADAVGAMKALNRLTVDYVKTRQQFGVPIGSFQVIQHRLVDMAIAQEMADAIIAAAIVALAGETGLAGRSEDERDRAVAAAKVRTAQSARLVAQQAVQTHGGMGLTEDYPAAHYFARLGMFERRWGDAGYHLGRFAAIME